MAFFMLWDIHVKIILIEKSVIWLIESEVYLQVCNRRAIIFVPNKNIKQENEKNIEN